MKWSWKIGEFAGIGVYMHATFLLLLGWVAFIHWQDGLSAAAVVSGLAFVLAIFACVVAHEYGHALTARRLGIRTREITLLPIGGVARLERMPDEPRQELWVALAGPVVNVVIAVGLFAWLQLTGGLVPVEQLAVQSGSFLERLMMVNLFLAAFNMLPAFPMDGGRVLRAVRCWRAGWNKHARHPDRRERRPGHGVPVRVRGPLLRQPDAAVHRAVCLDRRGTGIVGRADAGQTRNRLGLRGLRHSGTNPYAMEIEWLTVLNPNPGKEARIKVTFNYGPNPATHEFTVGAERVISVPLEKLPQVPEHRLAGVIVRSDVPVVVDQVRRYWFREHVAPAGTWIVTGYPVGDLDLP